MPRLSLTKAELQRQSRGLDIYRRFLPSLDLKRRQLIAIRARQQDTVRLTDAELADLRRRVVEHLPMAAQVDVDLDRLVMVQAVDWGEENLLGTRLPVLRGVTLAVRPYSLLATPHWVDAVADLLRLALTARVRRQIEVERLAVLEQAVRRITQRVNLFDKVLIPRAEAAIRRIRLHLADTERAGVVRAKLAKQKRSRTEAPP